MDTLYAVQTFGIIVIAVTLIYIVWRFDTTVGQLADDKDNLQALEKRMAELEARLDARER